MLNMPIEIYAQPPRIESGNQRGEFNLGPEVFLRHLTSGNGNEAYRRLSDQSLVTGRFGQML